MSIRLHLYSKKTWVLAGLAVGLSFVVSIGPQLQIAFVSVVTSPEGSIYSSAYQSNLTQFPELSEWFLQGVYFPFLPIAALIALASTRSATPRTIFLAGTGAAFLATSLSDLVIFAIAGDFSQLGGSLISNLLGAPLLGGLTLGLLEIAARTAAFAIDHPRAKAALALSMPVAIGVLIQVSAYYLAALFYNLTPAKIDVSIAAPVSGFYKASKEKDSKELFGFFGSPIQTHGIIAWKGMSTPLRLNWVRKAGETFDVSIWAYSGCVDNKTLSRIDAPRTSKIDLGDVPEVEVLLDKGFADAQLVDSSERTSKFELKNPNDIWMYWIGPSKKEQSKIDLTVFTGDTAELSYWSSEEPTRIAVGAFLLDRKTNLLSTRRFKLKVGTSLRTIDLVPSLPPNPKAPIGCRLLPLRNAQSQSVDTSGLYAGLLIESKPKNVSWLSPPSGSQFKVRGLNGWFSDEGLSLKQASEAVSAGSIGFLSFAGNAKQISIYENQVPTKPTDNYAVVDGDIHGELLESGEMHFTGTARKFVKNNERVNQTRWERLDWPSRGVLFMGFPALLLFVGRFIVEALRKNRQIDLH